MSKQGKLNLDCVASDPTSSFLYGIANARGDSSVDEYTILVKSNPNPSSIANVEWNIVSKVKIEETGYRYPLINTVVCAVSSRGEFSAFFYDHTYLSVAGPVLRPVGVRYDPRKVEAGTGGWSDILGSNTKLEWLDRFLLPLAFYVRDEGAGGSESVVLMLTDDFASLVRFGVVDEATNTLQLAGVWKAKPDGTYEKGAILDIFQYYYYNLQPSIIPAWGYTDYRRIAYGDGHLYFTTHTIRATGEMVFITNDTLTIYPFNKATDDPAPGVVSSPMPGAFHYGEHLFCGVRRDAGGSDVLYLGGIGYADNAAGQWTKLIQNPSTYRNSASDNTTIVLPHLRITNDTLLSSLTHYRLSRFQSVGGRLPGQVPFAVVPMTDGLYGVSLYGNASVPGSGMSTLTGPVDVIVYAEERIATTNTPHTQSLVMTTREVIKLDCVAFKQTQGHVPG
ncbi:hypothetical protein BGW39_011178 [Mortierella sp. 14UC]|nr:hypothetical protein BGW39_011178 [Mortierella sp. 14UC]